ncbi:hypothetical protein NUW54_g10938 [Trametes sanguinea]|uniref:Uncharacterized protein n=1 Tax=Trametes sanguinea TaxID=158606 RepID=A0ACC1NPT6_9APHY|nr:hypothetical protein NUW54_g10938 [Trametes sanguinea]
MLDSNANSSAPPRSSNTSFDELPDFPLHARFLLATCSFSACYMSQNSLSLDPPLGMFTMNHIDQRPVIPRKKRKKSMIN